MVRNGVDIIDDTCHENGIEKTNSLQELREEIRRPGQDRVQGRVQSNGVQELIKD